MEDSPKTGQWIGTATSEKGEKTVVVFNIEPRTPNKAQVILLPNRDAPRTVAEATVNWSGNHLYDGKIMNYHVYDEDNDYFTPIEETPEHKKHAEDASRLSSSYTADADVNRLWGKYEYSTGGKGIFDLQRDVSFGRKDATPPPFTWDQFKTEMAQFRGRGQVFYRGHNSNTHQLQTLLHRTGRYDVIKYYGQDLPRLRHNINAHSPHRYGKDRDDILALLSLAQHHGYPTPLLDWSRSPYVAAFFAFACDECETWSITRAEPVRVFAFDTQYWPVSHIASMRDPMVNLQFGEPDAHNNPRFVPQQSIAMYSNLDNIEGMVHGEEKRLNKRFLYRFDIRADQRESAIQDLRLMGITASSLYPGFEGICRSLRLQYFRQ